MARRRKIPTREIALDPRYGDFLVSKFVNVVMRHGKKSIAEGIVYGAFEQIEQKKKANPLDVFHEAVKNICPDIEVRSRRVGGATYQVPVEVRSQRARALAFRWLAGAALKRSERTMAGRLAQEVMDAAENRGAAVRKREEAHKMAEANRAFSHYRW
jgi:small subunit ribosomal protein S7